MIAVLNNVLNLWEKNLFLHRNPLNGKIKTGKRLIDKHAYQTKNQKQNIKKLISKFNIQENCE